MENHQQQPTQEQQLTKKERKELKRQQKLLNQDQAKQKKQVRRIFFWAMIVIIVAAGIFGFTRLNKKTQPINDNYHPAQDWIKGNRDAKVSLVEYSDFECPACRIYASILKQLSDEFGNNLSITYRHFPLRSVHKNANIAAQAAEAAGIQGKFWEMHDILFEKQQEWSELQNPADKFIEYASSLGLNTEQFQSDMNSDTVKKIIDDSYQACLALKLNSTPTFFLNGEKIDNPANYSQFKSLIQLMIDKK